MKSTMSADARASPQVWVDPRTWRVETLFGPKPATGSILRIGPARVEAVFSPSAALPPVGRTGNIAISNAQLSEPAVRQVIVGDRVDVAADLIMFGFDFRSGPDDHGDLTTGERRAVRIPVEDERLLRATVRCSAGEATGKVRDLSIAGVSIVCPAAAERQLATASGVEVRFSDTKNLGHDPVSGRIQNRRFDGDKSVLYGIEFSRAARPQLDQAIGRLQRSHVKLR